MSCIGSLSICDSIARTAAFAFADGERIQRRFARTADPKLSQLKARYFALHVFYEIVKHIAGELSANCCRTITMTRYNKSRFAYEWPALPLARAEGSAAHAVTKEPESV